MARYPANRVNRVNRENPAHLLSSLANPAHFWLILGILHGEGQALALRWKESFGMARDRLSPYGGGRVLAWRGTGPRATVKNGKGRMLNDIRPDTFIRHPPVIS